MTIGECWGLKELRIDFGLVVEENVRVGIDDEINITYQQVEFEIGKIN